MAQQQPTFETLAKCCGSRRWAERVTSLLSSWPSEGDDARATMFAAARGVWWNECSVPDWLEAFAAHPRIGNVDDLRKKFQNAKDMCSNEQSTAMQSSTEDTLRDLKEWNDKYERKFGHIFIIFATGKSADQVLAALKARFPNSPTRELMNAAIEQMKITELRIGKTVFGDVDDPPPDNDKSKGPGIFGRIGKIAAHVTGTMRSPITSHVLDIGVGRPAAGVAVSLERLMPGSKEAWSLVGTDVTNSDGRSANLLPPSGFVEAGVYKISFATGEYASAGKNETFYPHAAIVFRIEDHQVGATHTHTHTHREHTRVGAPQREREHTLSLSRPLSLSLYITRGIPRRATARAPI